MEANEMLQLVLCMLPFYLTFVAVCCVVRTVTVNNASNMTR
jgi:hypothetical protein